jgi:two-component system CheB/CheR fusion protein
VVEGAASQHGPWNVEALLAAIVESSDDAIVSKDLDGIVTSWNQGAERLFGYTAEEMIGKPIALLVPPERPDEEPAILARLRQGMRIDHYETVRVRKDGRRLDVSVTISPIRGPEGAIVGASKIARDISDRKRMIAELQGRSELIEQQNEELALQNEELAAQNEELEEADRHKNQFLAMLAHELRNPLAPIVNAMHLLNGQKYRDPFLLRNHEIISRQVRQMSRLLDDLLEVSRVTRGMVTLRVEPVDLAEVVNSAVHSLEDYVTEKGHRLSVDLPFTPVPVVGDPTRLHQVVSNLMSNSVKFTEPGGEIHVSLRQSGDTAELRVRDTGAGMPARLLPRVFELFTQEDQGLARAKGGLGVGLTIVRNLVEMHGGAIEALSEGPGRGSEFVVRLPVAPEGRRPERAGVPGAPAAAAPAEIHAGERSLAGAPQPAPWRSLRLLVIEDSHDTATTLGEILESWGYETRVATGSNAGKTGLALAAEQAPDVVLLDLGMPEMDGYQVAERLLAEAEPRPTLVALTGYGLEEDRRRTRAAGFGHHLTKPVDPEHLYTLLEELSSRKEVRGMRGGDKASERK